MRTVLVAGSVCATVAVDSPEPGSRTQPHFLVFPVVVGSQVHAFAEVRGLRSLARHLAQLFASFALLDQSVNHPIPYAKGDPMPCRTALLTGAYLSAMS